MPTPAQMMRDMPRRSTAAESAVQAFREAAKAEDLLQRKMAASENAAMLVPEDDRAWYVEQTEAIRREYEQRQESRPALYESRLSRIMRRRPRAQA